MLLRLLRHLEMLVIHDHLIADSSSLFVFLSSGGDSVFYIYFRAAAFIIYFNAP